VTAGLTPSAPRRLVSARLRLALSYAVFLVAAGSATLFGVYVVLRYVPDYPLTAANPRDNGSSAVASRQDILQAVINVSGIILLVLAAIGLIGGWLLAGWILHPLKRINQAATLAAGGDLHNRIALDGRNDEFRQLADNFDHMLDRLQDAFSTQERFAANASHELRTPLTITATLLEVARRNPEGQEYPALIERLQITNDRAVELTESLLRLADANAITAASQPVDLCEIVNRAIDEASDEAARRCVTISRAQVAAPAIGDAVLLSQLAANLVQNAIRHNTQPGQATITTGHDPALRTVTIRVSNGGAEYTAEAAASLVEPFLRGVGRVNLPGQRKGHGLGLTLVARIIDVHNGSLAVTPRTAGGLDIVVTLPDRAA
jgi:two-component system sensor histidine kinase VanS